VAEWAIVADGVPDLAFVGLPASRKVFADVVCTLADVHPEGGVRAGVQAKEWEKQKRLRYPVTDAQGRRSVPFDFVPLAFELHGRWGEDARAFGQRLAYARASAFGSDFSAEVARLYAIVSVGLQRGNAALILGNPMPGDPTRARRAYSRRNGPPDLLLAQ